MKVRPSDFIETMREKVAVSSVPPSALRGQGKGVLKASRDFLASVSLARIPRSDERRFRLWLDRQTESLLDEFPIRGRPWGAARKAINLFLRDSLYNGYLSRRYSLSEIESWFEVALDSAVAHGLKVKAGRGALPQWPGMKRLPPEVSDKFQAAATEQAQQRGFQRVHLDMYLWLENR